MRDPGKADLRSEIDLEVAKILASIQLSFPWLEPVLSLSVVQDLCALMYSEGLRKGVEKAKEVISQ